jgi:pimeloyl-ACP methyl ester carboxylesterase
VSGRAREAHGRVGAWRLRRFVLRWNVTIQELQHKGYTTVCGSNPLRGIPADAPYIGSLLDSIRGPVALVAHSMGGTVITNAAAGKTNVKALVYIAAFVPDVGETQGELITKFPGSEVEAVSVPVPVHEG